MKKIPKGVSFSEKKRGKLISIGNLEEGMTPSFDGTNLFYRSLGKNQRGNSPMVCCNGLGVSTFFWIYLEKMFRKTHQVVTWDYRGHGKSELKDNKKNWGLEDLVKDCKAVVEKLKLDRPILVGHSMGVQVILEYYRRWPKDVGGMILCFGTYGRPLDNFYNMKIARYVFDAVYQLNLAFPRESNFVGRLLLKNPLSFFMGGLLKMMHTGMVNRQDTDRYIEHILSVNPTFLTMLTKSMQESSSEDILSKIKVPTLIIAGEHDQFTPLWLSKKMNRLIPDSELFIMQKATHAGLVEQPDLINFRIEKFLQERVRPFLRKKKASK